MNSFQLETVKQLQSILGEDGGNSGHVYLFGAGEQCRSICSLMENKSIISGVIDSYKTGLFENIKIKTFAEAKKFISHNDVILVAARQPKEIIDILESHNYLNYLVCDSPWKFSYYKSINLNTPVEKVVEFYLVDAFEVFHFGPVVRFLNEHGIAARIVAEPSEINTAGAWFDYKTALSYLKMEKLEFETVCNPQAAWAVTTQAVTWLEKYLNAKINMAYGVSMLKDIFLVSKESCIGFDYKWVHGNYQMTRASKFMNVNRMYKIGYPKYMDKWSRTRDSIPIHGNAEKKPILAYFPTWDQYSSIKVFNERIKELRTDYYIVSKMHHCTERLQDKEDDRKILAEESDMVISSEIDIRQFIDSVDIVVADAKSGAASEIAFLRPDVQMLLLWPFDEDSVSIQKKFMDGMERFAPILTSRDDIKTELSKEVHATLMRKSIVDELYEPSDRNPLENIMEIFADV